MTLQRLFEALDERVDVVDLVGDRLGGPDLRLAQLGPGVRGLLDRTRGDAGEVLSDVLDAGGEDLTTDGAAVPALVERLAARRADVGRERAASVLALAEAQRLLGVLDELVVADVLVDRLGDAAPADGAEQRLQRVPVDVVLAAHDGREVVSEVVGVDGLVDAGPIGDAPELAARAVLRPRLALGGVRVVGIADEQRSVRIVALGMVLPDPVADVLAGAEQRALPAAVGRALEPVVLGGPVGVEVEHAVLEIDVPDLQREDRAEALAGVDQQLQERAVPGLVARLAQRLDLALGEHVLLGGAAAPRVAGEGDDVLVVGGEVVVVAVERDHRALVVSDGRSREAAIGHLRVHELVHVAGVGLEEIEAAPVADAQVLEVLEAGADAEGLHLPAAVGDHAPRDVGIHRGLELLESVAQFRGHVASLGEVVVPRELCVQSIARSCCHLPTTIRHLDMSFSLVAVAKAVVFPPAAARKAAATGDRSRLERLDEETSECRLDAIGADPSPVQDRGKPHVDWCNPAGATGVAA